MPSKRYLLSILWDPTLQIYPYNEIVIEIYAKVGLNNR